MACLVQSISHTPPWCLLLTMLIIPLSICRPSPSIIFPQIAILLTREQFLKSLQTLHSFSQLLPPFWSGADLALSPGWLSLSCSLSPAKVPLLLSLSHAICSAARLRRLGCAGPQCAAQQKLCCPRLPTCRVHIPHPPLRARTAGSLLHMHRTRRRQLGSASCGILPGARLIHPCNETPAKVLFRVSVLPQVCPGSELRALPLQGEGAYARWDATTAPGFHLPGTVGARPDKVSASPPQPGPSELEEG